MKFLAALLLATVHLALGWQLSRRDVVCFTVRGGILSTVIPVDPAQAARGAAECE